MFETDFGIIKTETDLVKLGRENYMIGEESQTVNLDKVQNSFQTLLSMLC